MSNFTRVYFPGLGIDFDLPSVAFTIGSYDIHFYGIIIAFGFMLAVLYGGRMAYKWRMSLDGMTDVLIWGTVFGIVCARAYYVIFEWSYYSAHPAEIVQIWNGGLAIYGGIIGALIGAAIGCKVGKIDFRNLLDLGALGLLIGQGIGRWGNFFNQEAFGTNTDTALFRMWSVKIRDTLAASSADLAAKGVTVDPEVPVHPTFLYESLWCVLGFLILNYIVHKHRSFKGEIFCAIRRLVRRGAYGSGGYAYRQSVHRLHQYSGQPGAVGGDCRCGTGILYCGDGEEEAGPSAPAPAGGAGRGAATTPHQGGAPCCPGGQAWQNKE